MPLGECMRSHTYEEYLMWMDWLDEQWNTPGLTEQYLMQIAAEVRRVMAKKPSSIKLKHFKLSFKRQKVQQDPKLTQEKALEHQWSTWMGVLGVTAEESLNLLKNTLSRQDEVEESEDG